ncbi:hypothetical protein CEXT_807311 [Caerostris extrusa]|uniref:Uncharacterized protein n=1 Tax=Caerostris extrusa TaxID=172846 RepID=A0AAV4XJS5_CAEEX|nr:hypothetical protein CEXT_807311 [Caerostris extrusa]
MGVLEEIFSTFGIKTSFLEESKPTPPKETTPPTDQVIDYIKELQALLIAKKNIIPNSSTEVAPNQVTPTTEEVIMDTSEESQNEPSPTEEPYQIPPKDSPAETKPLIQTPKGPEINSLR